MNGWGLMVDREMTVRDNRRLKTRLKNARLRQHACMEDIDFRHPRGLKREQFQQLLGSGWIKDHQNGRSCLDCTYCRAILRS
ncbi:ATP-binding protein [Endozoicomonas acroporae]|uniref:ATP-binding protein n=2 Tax=Endozoicomonas acroporae TaxID=1701104 RepID=UPI000C78DA61